MKKPNFFIIGAAKSGTSSLYHYVRQHPDICMSIPKETWFFCFEDYEAHGLEWYWNRYFAPHYQGEPIIGEASPWYLHMPHVAFRLQESVPEAKLVVILRNPVDRAFSEWWMSFRDGVENLPFQEAIKVNLQRLETQEDPLAKTIESAKYWLIYRGMRPGKIENIDQRPRTYVENGYYALQLERYFERFPPEQIKIFLYEDLVRDPIRVVKEIWRFLEVDPDHPVLDLRPRNVAPGVIGGIVLNFLRRKRFGRFAFNKVIRRPVVNLLMRIGEKPQIDPGTRKLLQEHYREHNRKLADMIGRDLSHWIEEGDT